jgi:hypothetical protein
VVSRVASRQSFRWTDHAYLFVRLADFVKAAIADGTPRLALPCARHHVPVLQAIDNLPNKSTVGALPTGTHEANITFEIIACVWSVGVSSTSGCFGVGLVTTAAILRSGTILADTAPIDEDYGSTSLTFRRTRYVARDGPLGTISYRPPQPRRGTGTICAGSSALFPQGIPSAHTGSIRSVFTSDGEPDDPNRPIYLIPPTALPTLIQPLLSMTPYPLSAEGLTLLMPSLTT